MSRLSPVRWRLPGTDLAERLADSAVLLHAPLEADGRLFQAHITRLIKFPKSASVGMLPADLQAQFASLLAAIQRGETLPCPWLKL